MAGCRKKYIILIFFLLGLLFLATVVALCMGQYKISASNTLLILFSNIFKCRSAWTDTMYRVVMYNRLPRVISAIAVGASLSLAGAAYQGFQKPSGKPRFAWRIERSLCGSGYINYIRTGACRKYNACIYRWTRCGFYDDYISCTD